MCPEAGGPRGRDEGGFALALVVMLLFAIGAAGTAGYHLVRSEAVQAQLAGEAAQALAVAEAGLQWFTATQERTVKDSAIHSVNGGLARITVRKVLEVSPHEDLFLVTSQGVFTDPRRPRMPAVRTVSQYAVHYRLPFRPMAALATTSPRVRVRHSGMVDGADHSPVGECPAAPHPSVAGVLARANVQTAGGGSVSGTPSSLTAGSFASAVQAVGLPWDVLIDPSFPVEYDDRWPAFPSLGEEVFPAIRVKGDFAPTAGESGRGLLIVTGTLRIPNGSQWEWKGVVLAGDLASVGPDTGFEVKGLLVAGQGARMGNWDMDSGRVAFHSCYALQAGAAVARLVPVPGTWFQGF
jgi:hypothetical protein